MYMHLALVKIADVNDPQQVKSALLELFDFDEDMNGNNGEEYLWDEARKSGYESNNEYLADKAVSETDTAEAAVDLFAKEFFDGNIFYYSNIELEKIRDNDSLYIAVASADDN